MCMSFGVDRSTKWNCRILRENMLNIRHKMSVEAKMESKGRSCVQHPEEQFKFYCTTHNEVICSICAVKLHKACDDTLTLAEAVEEFERERNNLFKALDKQRQDINSALIVKQAAAVSLSSTSTAIAFKIHDLANRLCTAVQAKEHELILTVEQLNRDHQGILKSDTDSLQQLSSVATKINKKAYKAFSKEAQIDTVLTIAKVQNAFCDIERSAKDVMERPLVKLDFHMAHEVQQFLHEFNSFGEVILCSEGQEIIGDTAINVSNDITHIAESSGYNLNSDTNYINRPPPVADVADESWSVVNVSDQMDEYHGGILICISEDGSPPFGTIPCFRNISPALTDSESSSDNETDDESSETLDTNEIRVHTPQRNPGRTTHRDKDMLAHVNAPAKESSCEINTLFPNNILTPDGVIDNESIGEICIPLIVINDGRLDDIGSDEEGKMNGIHTQCDNEILAPDNSTDEEIVDSIPTHVANLISIDGNATDDDSIDEIPVYDVNEISVHDANEISVHDANESPANGIDTCELTSDNLSKMNPITDNHTTEENNTPIIVLSTGNEMSAKLDNRIRVLENEIVDTSLAINESSPNNMEKEKRTRVTSDNGDSLKTFQTVDHGKPCWIYGLAYLPDKRLVVTDVAHDALQLYDSECQLLGETRVNFTPWDVAVMNDTTVAVCSGGKQTLNIFYIENNSFVPVRQFDLGSDCISVTYNDNVFTTGTRRGVVLASEDGTITSRIERSSDNEGFRRVDFLTVDSNHNNIFIVNSWASKTVCIAPDGRKNWEYQSVEVNPRGVAWYNGRLYVASRNQHKILSISEDGTYVDEVGGEGLTFPYAVAIHPASRAMAVSQWDEQMEAGKSRTVMVLTVQDG